MSEMNFKWSNYLKTTPKNVERILKSIRRLYLTVTGGTILANAPEWVTLTVLISGAIVEELSNFVGSIAMETEEQVVVKYPQGLADQINVSVESVTPPTTTSNVDDGEIH